MAGRRVYTFFADPSGNLPVIIAVLMFPILLVIGSAVDYSTARQKQSHMQDVVDAAALAVAQEVGLKRAGRLKTLASKYIAGHLPDSETFRIARFSVTEKPAKVNMTVDFQQPTSFMKIAGIGTLDIAVTSEAIVDQRTIEVALVLDNSGSMTGPPIDALKVAAKDFVYRLFRGQSTGRGVKVGIVPFTALVNVGAHHRGEFWLDMDAKSPVHDQGLHAGANRWKLYDTIANVDWNGCVEARLHPHDVNDTPPDLAKPETLWVPTFAPDEPDIGALNWYFNNYTPDGPYFPSWVPQWLRDLLGKYYNRHVTVTDVGGTLSGPNFLCDAQPITPLTDQRLTLDTAIGQMTAYGGTNMMTAMAWGVRVLSPSLPFTEGAAYGTKDNEKILVLMSDGANELHGLPNDLMSQYSSHNYAKFGRLGPASNNSIALVNQMNARTKQACTSAKQSGIRIVTIAFNINDAEALNLLEHCASKKSDAYTVQTINELAAVFEELVRNLTKLRIAQ